jgi:hypothetical protein
VQNGAIHKLKQSLKRLLIFMTLAGLSAGSAHAYQQEAVLQRIQIAGAEFDLVVATPKPDAAPDALVVNLIGGELVLIFDEEEKALKVLDSLKMPASTFHVRQQGSKLRIPVAIYIVPKPE